MSKDIEWRLVVDDEGAIKKMEQVSKDGEKVDKNLDKTKKTSSGLTGKLKELGGAFGGLKGMITSATGALGLFGAGYGIENIISSTKTLAEETEKFHAVTGMSANSSLDYVAALKAWGIGTEAVVRGYKALGKAVQTAERGEYTFATAQEKSHAQGKLYTGLLNVQAEAFQKLGVNLNALKSMSPEKQFQVITEKLEGMKAGLQKTTIASSIFGKGATALLPVLDRGPLSLNHYRSEAEKFFPTLKGGTNILNEMNAASAESKLAWEGMQFTLGTAVMPELVKVEHGFAEVISEIEHGKGAWGGLESDLKGIGEAGKDVVGWLDKMGKAFNIPVGAGGLGAALATFAGIHAAKHPIKTVTGTAKAIKGIVNFFKGAGGVGAGAGAGAAAGKFALPGLGPLDVGASGALDAFMGYKLVKGYTSPTPAGMTTGQERESLAKFYAAQGKQEHDGSPTTIHQRQLVLLEDIARSLHAHGESGQQIIGELHMDSTKVGEVIALNPKAMRFLAEGVERHSLKRGVGHG